MMSAMSNLELDSEPNEVDAGPVDDGQVAETVETIDEAPSYDYLDLDDTVTSKYVKVKVDGEELDVPLTEALQGYQRQADYTRKTQEAASLREQAQEALRLQQAFQADPGLTVQVLARNAGVSVEEFLGMTPRQQAAAVADAKEDEYVDPLERALAEERNARIALQERIEQREADEYLRSQIAGLKQTYQIGDDEVRDVVQQALRMGVGPEAFPMIYQAQAFQKLQVQQGTQQEVAAAAAEDDAKRRAAAAAQANVVGTGSGATNVTTAAPVDVHMTPREAAEQALSSLNY
jgi:hypothetical protein